MNKNFHAIQSSKLQLTHQQTQLAQNFHLMQTHEKQLACKELYIELRMFESNAVQNFLYNLDEILKTTQLDPHFEIVFQLLRKHEYCFNNLCYSLPIFKVLGELYSLTESPHQPLVPHNRVN